MILGERWARGNWEWKRGFRNQIVRRRGGRWKYSFLLQFCIIHECEREKRSGSCSEEALCRIMSHCRHGSALQLVFTIFWCKCCWFHSWWFLIEEQSTKQHCFKNTLWLKYVCEIHMQMKCGFPLLEYCWVSSSVKEFGSACYAGINLHVKVLQFLQGIGRQVALPS